MLYIAYLPKVKGEDLEERKINRILKWYMTNTKNEYSVIAVPGYLSQSDSSIDYYISELSKILVVGSEKVKIGF